LRKLWSLTRAKDVIEANLNILGRKKTLVAAFLCALDDARIKVLKTKRWQSKKQEWRANTKWCTATKNCLEGKQNGLANVIL